MRTVDEVIEYIRRHPSIPPVHKQVMITRIDKEPTREELEDAKRIVYP